LVLEAVRPSTGAATPEVEHFDATLNHVLHESPVQQHVGILAVFFTQGRHPGRFELVPPDKATSSRNWPLGPIDSTENRLPAEYPG
jgi:hypothetical protein